MKFLSKTAIFAILLTSVITVPAFAADDGEGAEVQGLSRDSGNANNRQSENQSSQGQAVQPQQQGQTNQERNLRRQHNPAFGSSNSQRDGQNRPNF